MTVINMDKIFSVLRFISYLEMEAGRIVVSLGISTDSLLGKGFIAGYWPRIFRRFQFQITTWYGRHRYENGIETIWTSREKGKIATNRNAVIMCVLMICGIG